jgi:short-subunit dehydrogenase
MPGAVGTNITAHSGVEIPVADPEAAAAGRKVTSPEEAANIILNGIEKGDLHIYVGRDSRMMNIFSRVAPRRPRI